MKNNIWFTIGLLVLGFIAIFRIYSLKYNTEIPKIYRGKIIRMLETKSFNLLKMQEVPVYYVVFHSDSINKNIMVNIVPDSYFNLTEGGQIKVYLTDSETQYMN